MKRRPHLRREREVCRRAALLMHDDPEFVDEFGVAEAAQEGADEPMGQHLRGVGLDELGDLRNAVIDDVVGKPTGQLSRPVVSYRPARPSHTSGRSGRSTSSSPCEPAGRRGTPPRTRRRISRATVLNWPSCPTVTLRPARFAASMSARASVVSIVKGFSTRMWAPYSRHARPIGRWRLRRRRDVHHVRPRRVEETARGPCSWRLTEKRSASC